MIREVIAERRKTHGDYTDMAEYAQGMKDVLHRTRNWSKLRPYQKEFFEMAVHKFARALAGDPDEPDHYVDTIGYAQMVVDRLEERKKDSLPNRGDGWRAPQLAPEAKPDTAVQPAPEPIDPGAVIEDALRRWTKPTEPSGQGEEVRKRGPRYSSSLETPAPAPEPTEPPTVDMWHVYLDLGFRVVRFQGATKHRGALMVHVEVPVGELALAMDAGVFTSKHVVMDSIARDFRPVPGSEPKIVHLKTGAGLEQRSMQLTGTVTHSGIHVSVSALHIIAGLQLNKGE